MDLNNRLSVKNPNNQTTTANNAGQAEPTKLIADALSSMFATETVSGLLACWTDARNANSRGKELWYWLARSLRFKKATNARNSATTPSTAPATCRVVNFRTTSRLAQRHTTN